MSKSRIKATFFPNEPSQGGKVWEPYTDQEVHTVPNVGDGVLISMEDEYVVGTVTQRKFSYDEAGRESVGIFVEEEYRG